ncbi:S-formylglutathione hydrolase [Chromatiales bacterium (ex Bugula neritina AB1)]|nr:S-formylglutathione hydrolase [Chromatiales bacterium (ex Bugula neritina AB1)]
MENTEQIKEFGGTLNRYVHKSKSCNCDMTFSIYLPPQAEKAPVPALYYLSGLTCTDDNVRTKAGAQRYAAEHGLALIMPDTSPRGDDVADEPDRYDLGKGAGFYVNATAEPWAAHYQMYDYINSELPELVEATAPVIPGLRSITGHSMGGHGALISALKQPGVFRSVSAFSPICNPVNCAWGEGCFGAYLGDNRDEWQNWDASVLISRGASCPPMLVDQGTADSFLADQLNTQTLIDTCDAHNISAKIRMQNGYDHSYHFIASFIGEHIAFHAKALNS